jgi:hypothetical protein
MCTMKLGVEIISISKVPYEFRNVDAFEECLMPTEAKFWEKLPCKIL